MALRRTGVELVTKNLAGFLSGMGRADKSVLKFTDSIDRVRTTAFSRSGVNDFLPSGLLQQVSNLTDLFGGLTGRMGDMQSTIQGANSMWSILNAQMARTGYTGRNMFGVWGNINQQVESSTSILDANKSVWSALNTQMQGNVQATDSLGSLWTNLNSAITGVTAKINVLAVAAVGLGAAFAGLGQRGAHLPGIIEGFDTLSRYAETTANTLRGDLRRAARGTVADVELMRTANLALAGTEPELAKALGQGGLAGLLEIARTQARATGQSVNYLYESLVLGVKRTSPRLVDNTGLVIGQTAAYEAFAKQAGKSADALSEVEKQIAILNFTLEKGEVAVETYGQSGLIASERMARITVLFKNALDRLAVAVQPLYNAVLAVGETLVNALLAPLKVITPLVYELSKAIGGPLLSAWERLTNTLGKAFEPAARLVHRWMLTLIGIIRAFGMAWDWLVRQIVNVLGPFADILRKYLIEPLSKVLDPTTMFKAAGFAFGAFAEGILWAFNTAIAPAILLIVDFIADFLMGESPPPKGRLSKIDRGGYRTMLAWLEGFLGVSLTPVDKMARRIDRILGGIGRLTHEQVEGRLARLDRLLEPFIANLDIARAKMERITEPLRAVQDILERKLDRALAKFFKGDITAEAVRQIDRQMEGIEERVFRAQALTDQAEVQLALAKSQQALERALLEIQLRRTKAAEKEKKTKEKKGKAEEPTLPDADIVLPELGGDVLGDFLGIDDDEVRELWGELGDAFMEGVELTGFNQQLEKARENVGKMGEQFKRFSKAPTFLTTFQSAFDPLFTGPDSIGAKMSGFADQFEKAWQRIKDIIPIDSVPVDTLRIALSLLIAPTIIQGLWSLAAGIGGLALSLVGLVVGNFINTFRWIIAASAAPVVSGIVTISRAIIAMTTASVVRGMAAISRAFNIITKLGTTVVGAIAGSAALAALLLLAVIGIANRWDEFKQHVTETVEALTEGDLLGVVEGIGKAALDIPTGLAEFIANIAGMSDTEFYAGLEAWEGILGNIETILSTLKDNAVTWLKGLGDTLKEWLFKPFDDIVKDIDDLIFGNSPTLKTILEDIPNAVAGWLIDNAFTRMVRDHLYQPFKDVVDDVYNWLTNPDQAGSLADTISDLPDNIQGWISDLTDTLDEHLFRPFTRTIGKVWSWLVDKEKKGGLAHTIYNLPGKIAGWLSDLGTQLTTHLLGPFKGVIDDILGGLNTIKDTIANLSVPSPGDIVGGAVDWLGEKIGGGARGAVVPAGRLMMVGEKGWEFFRPNVGGQVFSHARSVAMAKQMSRLSHTVASYQPGGAVQYVVNRNDQSVQGGHTYDHRQTTNNFQVQGTQSWRLILAQTKAFNP